MTDEQRCRKCLRAAADLAPCSVSECPRKLTPAQQEQAQERERIKREGQAQRDAERRARQLSAAARAAADFETKLEPPSAAAPDPITEFYQDRANGHHANRAR